MVSSQPERPDGPQNSSQEPWEWPKFMCKELWEAWFRQNPQEKKVLPIDIF
jgi:hypothetical protein